MNNGRTKKKTIWLFIGLNIFLVTSLCSGVGYFISKSLLNKNNVLTPEESIEHTVAKQDLVGRIYASGEVVNDTKVLHSFSVDGTVKEVLVQTGDFVKKGTVLAKLDEDKMNEELEDAQDNVDSINSSISDVYAQNNKDPLDYQRLKNELDIATINYNNALESNNYLSVKSDIAGRVYKVNSSDDDFVIAGQSNSTVDPSYYDTAVVVIVDEASYNQLLIDPNSVPTTQFNVFSRIEGIIDNMVVSPGDTVALNQELFILDSSSVEINIKQAENAKLSAQKSLDDFNKGTNFQSQIKDLQKQLARATQDLEKAKKNLEAAELKSDIDGTVSVIDYNAGTQINSTTSSSSEQKGITVVDPSVMSISIKLGDNDISYIKKGLKSQISFENLKNKTVSGEVVSFDTTPIKEEDKVQGGVDYGYMGPGGGLTNQYEVRIRMNQPDEQIRAGLTAQVVVETFELKNALVIPISALKFLPQEGKLKVQLLENGSIKLIDVETGVDDGESIEVKSGLKEGDTILLKTSDTSQFPQENSF